MIQRRLHPRARWLHPRTLILGAVITALAAPATAGTAPPPAAELDNTSLASDAFATPAPASAPAVAPAPPELGLRLGRSVLVVPHGQYRPRALAHGKRDFAAGSFFEAVSHRARLGLETRIGRWLSFSFEAQDVRLWGEETNTLSDYAANGFDVHQAWAEARAPYGLSLRVGRQEINLDEQRLIGAVGWSDQGRAFDGVTVDYACPRELCAVRALWAKTGEQDALVERTEPGGEVVVTSGARNDADLAALWLRLTRWPWLRPSLSAIFDRIGVLDQDRLTFGLYVDSAPLLGGLTYRAEGYVQLGRNEDGASGKVSRIRAWLAAGRLSYRAAALPGAPSLAVWIDALSGDDDATDDTLGAFDTLFATNHGYYGYMDFFTAVPANTGNRGLIDLGARLKVEPTRRLAAWLDWHHFRTIARDGTGKRVLGNELDLLVDYTLITKHLSVQAVMALMVPEAALSALHGGGRDTELYGYLQTDLRF